MFIVDVPIRRVTQRVNGQLEDLYVFEGFWQSQHHAVDGPQEIQTISNPLKEWAMNNVGGTGDLVYFRFAPVPRPNYGEGDGRRDLIDDNNGRF
jgi:hypothetical protein